MQMKNENKTRNLSAAEYFMQMQKEYLIADFRRKIYYNPKDKAYWAKVCGYKKERIDDIAQRNNLNSIFTSEEKFKEVRRELFDETGRPIFPLTPTDQYNYYAPGNEFAFNGEIYTLEKVTTKLTLKNSKGQEQIVSRKDVVRIL